VGWHIDQQKREGCLMVKVVGICGSPIKGGNTEVFLDISLKAAAEEGAQTTLLSVAGKELRDCTHCNWCVRNQREGKYCAIDDFMNEVYPEVLQADGIILASPAYISRLSGYLAMVCDRLRVFVHGNIGKHALKGKVGGALTVLWKRHSGAETTLLSLVQTFLILEMYPVSPGMSLGAYGAVGLSSYGGTGRFDPEDKLAVLKDDFGLEGAKAVGREVVRLARLIKAGKEALAKQGLQP